MAEHALAVRRISRTSLRAPALASRRVAAPAKQTEEQAKEKIDGILKSIATVQHHADAAAEKLKALQDDLEKVMKESGIAGYTTGVWTAEIVDEISRASRTPDPMKVFRKVGQEAFFKLIKVSTTDLKGHLTDKEINALSTVVEAKKIGTKLKITRKKK